MPVEEVLLLYEELLNKPILKVRYIKGWYGSIVYTEDGEKYMVSGFTVADELMGAAG